MKPSIKLVISKKLPADFSVSNQRKGQQRYIQQRNRQLLAKKQQQRKQQQKKQQMRKERKQKQKRTKNPFKLFHSYIDQAQKCKQDMLQLPQLSLQRVTQLIHNNNKHIPPLLSFQDIVTLGIIKNARSTGAIKKLLHVPSFKVFAAKQQQFQSKSHLMQLKQWITGSWKKLNQYDYFVKVIHPFWNLPQGYITLLTQLCQGGSFLDLLNNVGALPQKAIRQLAIMILQAYSIANQQKVIYNGLSPSQILFTSQGQIKLSLILHTKLQAQQPGLVEDYLHNSFWNQDLSFNGSHIQGQIFKLGVILLLSVTGGPQISQNFGQLLYNGVRIMRNYSKNTKIQNSKICCLIHSQAFVLSYPNSTTKKPKLPLLSILASYSNQLQQFLCKLLRIDPMERGTIQDLLNNPFIVKNLNLKKISLKDMIKLNREHGNLFPTAMIKAGQQRLKRLLQSMSIIMSQLKKQIIINIESCNKIGNPVIKTIAQELAIDQAHLVFKIKDLINTV